MTHSASPSSPPCARGSCALSSSCRHACVLDADASPAQIEGAFVEYMRTLWSVGLPSISRRSTCELGNETAGHSTPQQAVQMRAPEGALLPVALPQLPDLQLWKRLVLLVGPLPLPHLQRAWRPLTRAPT